MIERLKRAAVVTRKMERHWRETLRLRGESAN
jgi:hypothetical protein